MLYTIDVRKLPVVTNCYRIERKTVWSAVDPDNILVFVHSGRCLFRTEREETAVGENEAYLIPAGQEYVRRPLEEKAAVFTYLHFRTALPLSDADPAEIRSRLKEDKTVLETAAIAESPAGLLPLDRLCVWSHTSLDGRAAGICESIVRESERRHVESGYFVSLLLSELLGLLMQTAAGELLSDFDAGSLAPVPPRLKKAVLHIRRNLNRTVSLGELSRVAGVSPQHVIRLFRSELDATPLQYINRLKIQYAKHLIQFSPSLSMKEIGYELGFENPHYFSRLFTKLAGESPSSFRARVRLPDGVYRGGLPPGKRDASGEAEETSGIA